jgi:cellulose synthase/poly-beta-1,6-N-acetylglucosamine synthase-like glycosyltransferase
MFAHSFLVFNNQLVREAVAGPGETSFFMVFMVTLYAVILGALSLYGGHRYVLVMRYLRQRKNQPRPQGRFSEEELPGITVQLPIYNELYVIDRLLDAVGALDYPRDRLQVQVLDDSTDESMDVAARAVERWRRQGLDVSYLHRCDRTGYKAGALEGGLKKARHELIAIFDADFCPEPDFLRKMVHYFTDPKVGLVQSRWGHLNEEQSLLTRVQSLMLNGHFMVEHPARNRSGLFFNFNGTGGIWRREAIEDAGGWEHDTITEDLDLSYRAQMKGWQFIYDPEIVCPAELPVEMNAFKTQQHRWAKGSIQVMRKILPRFLKADLPFKVKLEGFLHLTGNLCYPLMFTMCVLILPMMVLRARIADGTLGAIIDLVVFLSATASVITFYTFTSVVAHRRWGRRMHLVPMMLALGIGLVVNQARAVIEALRGHQSPFVRTPKFNQDASSRGNSWLQLRYRGAVNWSLALELAFSLYFTVVVAFAVREQLWSSLPFLLLFFIGFWYVSILSLAQSSLIRRRRPVEPPVVAPEVA